jgi:cytochrome c-type biogenesis protein CcmF
MIPEFGLIALIFSLIYALLLVALPSLGVVYRKPTLVASATPLATMLFLSVLVSFLFLVWSFLVDDFSVRYVATNSNSLLPWYYKISATWGAHEGSMLLWVLVLGGWIYAVAALSGDLPREFRAIALSVLGFVASGFLLFLLLTSNPFDRLLPFPPAEGNDLNPLLQDFGLIIHPPLLYMGYVGFSVAFSFAVAALICGKLDASWARWLRPWTNTAWAFLTLGIALGSWWAYYELGWGGWWFWDPVENASLMPWLVGTALAHSLAVSEKRDMFKRWTLMLALMAFSLSLLGTFLVRSGVLSSVHAFANDPERGLFILLFLSIVVGGSLTLFALRVKDLEPTNGFFVLSREGALLVNNLFLVLMASVVLLGTLYPLVIDALNLGSVSVGPPYFNLFLLIFGLPMLLVLAMGQRWNWKKMSISNLAAQLPLPTIVAVVLGSVVALLIAAKSPLVWLGSLLASWILAHTLSDIWQRSRSGQSLSSLRMAYWGMVLGHLGIAVTTVGITFSTELSDFRDVRMRIGSSQELARYVFQVEDYRQVSGANYTAEQAQVRVSRDGRTLALLEPEKRRYAASGSIMTEAGISGSLWRDLYVSMGEPLGTDDWAMRIHVKPFIRWVWLGAAMIAIGAVVAIMDKRYRRQQVRA